MPAKDYRVDAPCWVDLTSSDPRTVVPFYNGLFGWEADVSKEAEYGGYTTFLKNDEPVAGLGGQMPGTTIANVWNTYIASADAEASVAKSVEAGAQVLCPAMQVGDQGTMALVVDAGGAVTGIWQADQHRGYGLWGEHGTPVWHEQFTHHYGAALEFYESVFGWTYGVLGDTDEFRYSQGFVAGGMVAGIMDADRYLQADVPSHWRLYFGVDDTDAAVEKVTALGGTVVDAAKDSPFGRIAGIADPLGARFQIASIVQS
ncbi:VOC family protein [Rhodococcus sp. Eu-32]|uniref:VOC family protein n=1 Tax=Rhodococcus sp. Eu-32 TaxID=1017319 RepID=UPI000DF46208|nr:VOC family protein [Rhodococcus sp. Eu-32]RRQ25497.1 VOC family protein [Rhodococcus sp. Eu-32]